MRPFLTPTAALRIYQVFIIPLFTYYSLINYNFGRSRTEAMLIFEERACKIINMKNIPFTENASKKTCATVKKCLSGDFPLFMDYFEYVTHEYSTCNNNKVLHLPKIKMESSKKSVFL